MNKIVSKLISNGKPTPNNATPGNSTMVCNYTNNYYGDQVCVPLSSNKTSVVSAS